MLLLSTKITFLRYFLFIFLQYSPWTHYKYSVILADHSDNGRNNKSNATAQAGYF